MINFVDSKDNMVYNIIFNIGIKDVFMTKLIEKMILIIVSVFTIVFLGKMIGMDKNGIFYAAIASVVISQNSELIKKASVERIFGTIIGGVAGVILTYSDLLYNSKFQLVFIVIGLGLVMYFCEIILKIPSSIACIVFLAVILKISLKPYIEYTVFRIFETSFGVIITIIYYNYLKPLGIICKKYN